jgi:flavodoxin
MKTLVTYWSQTGNTRKIAEAIYETLSCEKEIKSFDEVDSLEGFDLTFIGFPVMQFGPPVQAKKFIATKAKGKTIALFVTHATLSASDNPSQQDLLEKELNRCRAACSQSDLVGMFHCQGELSEKMANELHGSGISMLMEFAALRTLTIGHPDEQEIEQAKDFSLKMTTLRRATQPGNNPPY